MSKLFGGKPKGPSKDQLRSQRRQNQSVEQQTSEEAREAGARRRTIQRNRQGGSLFSQTGAAGIKSTLGG